MTETLVEIQGTSIATSHDVLYDLQLLRDLEIVNSRTQAEFGPLPHGGLLMPLKRKPKSRQSLTPQALAEPETEDDAMKLSHAVVAAALGTAGTLAACGADGASQGRDAKEQVADTPKATTDTGASTTEKEAGQRGQPTSRSDSSEPPSTHGISKSEALNPVPSGEKNQFAFDPSRWDKQPAFRESFKSCWNDASDPRLKLACIREEMAYQENAVNKAYGELHSSLPEKEWIMFQDDVSQWFPEDEDSCRFPSGDGVKDIVDEEFCKVYRKAALANYLDVALSLNKE